MALHDGGESSCYCPMCKLTCYVSGVYGNQRRASKHVMLARPSPFFAGTGGIPPPLPSLDLASSPQRLRVCPVYEAYGFCPFSCVCFLPHVAGNTPLVRPAHDANKEFDRLVTVSRLQEDQDLWNCAVCGYEGIDENSQGKVGETYYYRQCPNCSLMCYHPHLTYLIGTVLEAAGDDYQIFKTVIDRYREAIPDILKIPLTYEAHRLSSMAFAWSLVSPKCVKDALDAAYRALPEMVALVSIGSGSGYIEHVFNRVANGVAAVPNGPDVSLGTSSFEGVHACFYPHKKIPIFAFDEVALNCPYSVAVSLGGPASLLSLNCAKSVLLLCWPPFGSPQEEQSSMGFESLEYFTQAGGNVVIYIGDVASTGDWRFHELLYTHYKLVKEYTVRRELRRWYPQEMGLVYAGNDTIGVYKKREQPLPSPQWQWGGCSS
ncbi:hypothetical protein TraAM80_07932 [Trypanosoma rangeli]|uniref:C3H1-type domain-containing protein n=1 Tax=Trypanosoma rangeli TaxID=5698 RepID=A0A3R7LMJ5_TRYRA|nr:uncharacterized protein TraAM80_07932 [Trypanosoma rangeli]RNE99916.1 hypothetical protein TraAM80_07932 [Trypanosoma rangeli]|eukprot:RNE99916.1 hypothetical protein TraAM80_07932 [Trypanosoma rangeli]